MSAAPDADGANEDQFVDLLAVRLDRFVERDRAEAAPADATAPADPALIGALLTELRAETTWSGPPPGLRDSILARVRAEAAPVETVAPVEAVVTAPQAAEPEAHPVPDLEPQPQPQPQPEPVSQPEPETVAGPRWWQPERWRPRFGRLTWALPAAVVAAAAFTAIVLGVDRWLAPDPPPADVFVATGTTLAPGSSAKISITDTPSGSSIVIEPTGLPPAAPGSYYAAWLKGPQGSVPIGSFHERRPGTPIELWSGVDIEDYPMLTVTLQAEGAPPTPSGILVMSAALG